MGGGNTETRPRDRGEREAGREGNMCDARRGRNCRILPRPLRPILTVLAFRGLRLAGYCTNRYWGCGALQARSGRPRDPRHAERARFGDPDGTGSLNYAPRVRYTMLVSFHGYNSIGSHNLYSYSCTVPTNIS